MIHLTPYTKINTKWISDLNISAKIIKFKKNMGVNTNDWFFQRMLTFDIESTGKKRKKIDKLYFIKFKSFYISKNIIKEVKRQPTQWEKNT